MNTAFWLSLVMALAGCTGLILAGRGMWQGWAIGLAVQPVWAIFAVVTKGYGLLITCLMYGFVYGKNLLKWRRKKNENPYKSAVRVGAMSINESRQETLEKPQTIVVVAGNASEAIEWFDKHYFDYPLGTSFLYVNSFRDLEGLRYRPEDVFRVGSYANLQEITEIEDLIERNKIMYGRRSV